MWHWTSGFQNSWVVSFVKETTRKLMFSWIHKVKMNLYEIAMDMNNCMQAGSGPVWTPTYSIRCRHNKLIAIKTVFNDPSLMRLIWRETLSWKFLYKGGVRYCSQVRRGSLMMPVLLYVIHSNFSIKSRC